MVSEARCYAAGFDRWKKDPPVKDHRKYSSRSLERQRNEFSPKPSGGSTALLTP